MSVELGVVLDRLYAAEINFRISAFWDAGIDVGIGNLVEHGWNHADAVTNVRTAQEAAGWLHIQAMRLYPEYAANLLPEPADA
jgi:hypothetical protein